MPAFSVSTRKKAVERALRTSKTRVPLALKLRLAELALRLMGRRRKFGLFIILGWRSRWNRFADTPDVSQDIFKQHHVNIMHIGNGTPTPAGDNRKTGPIAAGSRNITSTVNFDGAILIDVRGNVLHSGAMIENLRPREIARKLNPHATPDLSSQFGFRQKVHMRHIAAITSSYIFPGTTVFTVSEETNDLHIFENGKIVYSTVPGETKDPA